jgi:BirA family biotin operon repressor/biotin-[acetyl-CoA-carboxylase] ligase
MIRVVYKNVVDNTNDEAKRYLEQEALANTGMGKIGLALVSATQKNAKCRYNRKWLTPYKNIALTLAITRPERCNSLLPFYAITLHLIQTVLSRFIQNNKVEIRWPNDILVDGNKLSSTFIEFDKKKIFIGININYNLLGKDVGCPAVDIMEYNETVSIGDVVNSLLAQLESYLFLFERDDTIRFIKHDYESVMHGIYEDVEVSLDEKKSKIELGICRGIDSKGQILLDDIYTGINAWSIYDAIIKD